MPIPWLSRSVIPLAPIPTRRPVMRAVASLTLAMALVVSGGAAASDVLGMFFDGDDFEAESAAVNTTPGSPFYGYVVLLDASPSSVGAYEVGITFTSSSVTSLGVTGPNGWTNFGDDTNHLVGFVTPLPTNSSGTVLCTMNLMQMDSERVDIEFGPASPASISGVPVIADGNDLQNLIECELYGGGPVVASLNAPPHQFQEIPLSEVKALFD
jgi:hypothetical protein